MTGQEFAQALARLGWSQAEISRRLGVHQNTSSRWHLAGPPGYVAEYLRVMELASRIMEAPHDRR